jgi:hypothetical protein
VTPYYRRDVKNKKLMRISDGQKISKKVSWGRGRGRGRGCGRGRVHGMAQLVLFTEKSELISTDCCLRLQASALPLGFLSSNRPSKMVKSLAGTALKC